MDITQRIFTRLIVLFSLLLVSCAPEETVIQTAIAHTQEAAITATQSEQGNQSRVLTAVAQTLTPMAAISSQNIQIAVIQTLTSIAPSQTQAPLFSPTVTTLTPTITLTRTPRPTITNTVEAAIPSGPITLTKVEDAGNEKASLSWEAEGNFLNGIYIVWSPSNAAPVFPTDYWNYFANGHIRSAAVDVKQGNTYYFRVCEVAHDGKQCINYSNAIQATIR